MTSDGRIYCVFGHRNTQVTPSGALDGGHWWPIMWRPTASEAHDLVYICEQQAVVYRKLLIGSTPFEARVDYLERSQERVDAKPHIASIAQVTAYKAAAVYHTAPQYRQLMYDRVTMNWELMPRYGYVAWDDDSLNTPLSAPRTDRSPDEATPSRKGRAMVSLQLAAIAYANSQIGLPPTETAGPSMPGAATNDFSVGDRVLVTHDPQRDRTYQVASNIDRYIHNGQTGNVLSRRTGHGLCFTMDFPPGNSGTATYDAEELTLAPL